MKQTTRLFLEYRSERAYEARVRFVVAVAAARAYEVRA
jgi:hypothetical protein